MFVYYSVLAGLSAVGACLCVIRRSRLKDGIFAIISFIVLAGLSAVRYDVGTDYSYIYGPEFDRFFNDPTGEYLDGHRFEPGFKLLFKAVRFFTLNYQAQFAVISILTIGLIILFFWLRSPNIYISVFLFITLSYYYCSMNFLRQTLAASIAIYALLFLEKRGIISAICYFAIIGLAAMFHVSTLIMIPFYFISMIPINKYVLAAYAVVTTLVYFNTHPIINFVTKYWYRSYGIDNIHMKSAFEITFAIAGAVIVVFILLNSKAIQKYDGLGKVYVYCTLYAFFFALMASKHSIIDRLALYSTLTVPVAGAIAIHHLSQRAKDKKDIISKSLFAGSLALIYAGGIFIHHYALGKDYHGVDPYQTVFSQPFYADYVDSLKGDKDTLDSDVIIYEPEDIRLGEKNPNTQSSAEPPALPQSPESSMPEGAPGQVSFEEFIKNTGNS